MVCVSHEFVYGAVKVNKIIAVFFLTKPPSYAYARLNVRLKLYLSWSANPW